MPKKGFKGETAIQMEKYYNPNYTAVMMAKIAGIDVKKVRNYCYTNNLPFKKVDRSKATPEMIRDVQHNIELGSRDRGAKYFSKKWGVSMSVIYRILDMKMGEMAKTYDPETVKVFCGGVELKEYHSIEERKK